MYTNGPWQINRFFIFLNSTQTYLTPHDSKRRETRTSIKIETGKGDVWGSDNTYIDSKQFRSWGRLTVFFWKRLLHHTAVSKHNTRTCCRDSRDNTKFPADVKWKWQIKALNLCTEHGGGRWEIMEVRTKTQDLTSSHLLWSLCYCKSSSNTFFALCLQGSCVFFATQLLN